PSDPTDPDNVSEKGTAEFDAPDGNPWASCSYAANIMVFDPAGPGTLVTAMPDGSSNTVILGHRYKDCQGPNGWAETDWAAYPWDSPYGYWSVPGFGYSTYFNLYAAGGTKISPVGCPASTNPCWAGTNRATIWQGWPDFTSTANAN